MSISNSNDNSEGKVQNNNIQNEDNNKKSLNFTMRELVKHEINPSSTANNQNKKETEESKNNNQDIQNFSGQNEIKNNEFINPSSNNNGNNNLFAHNKNIPKGNDEKRKNKNNENNENNEIYNSLLLSTKKKNLNISLNQFVKKNNTEINVNNNYNFENNNPQNIRGNNNLITEDNLRNYYSPKNNSSKSDDSKQNASQNNYNNNQNINSNPKQNEFIPPNNNNNNIKISKTCLKPIGETSYLNAILQCLGNIGYLESYFLEKQNINYIENNIRKIPLSFVIERLFHHLHKSKKNNEIYSNENILRVLSSLNITYKSNNRRNPNDCLIFILDTLHNELNRLKNNKGNKNYDIYDRKTVINTEIINFQNTNDSIISTIFNWFQLKNCLCTECNKIMTKLNTFNSYDLDIFGYSRFVGRPNYFTIKEIMLFESNKKFNGIYCQNCKKITQMECNSRIFTSPNIFTFLINRDNFKPELLKLNLSLEAEINLSNLIECQNSPKIYELIGIVSIYNNKYISFCKSSKEQNWYLFNDEEFEIIDQEQVISKHNDNFYIPCILFYKKK